MYQLKASFALILPALLASNTAYAEAQPVTPYADLRYRLELVDQDSLAEKATASTLRIRAGVKTGEWHGLSALVEGEAIAVLGKASYNDTVNGKLAYPVVADPSDVLLNQAWLNWKPVAGLEATVGRQAINIDNQRWIGSVAWRQNDQTLDAVRVTARPVKGASIDYVHAWRVNRVFGSDSAQGIWRDTGIHAVRAAYTIKNIGTLSAYGFWLDIPSSPASSSRTLGVRIAGELPVGGKTAFLYAAEYARQHQYGSNPHRFELDYWLFEPGIKTGPVTVKVGYERLEGNGTVALQTPLATLHAFNGWADKFLTTPANGLRDFYLDASYKVPSKGPLAGLVLRAAWHDYNSTTGGIAYGREWDALVSFPLGKHFTLTAKAARYEADAFATDTTKLWLQIEAKF
ncbi:alginate export family protein [Novosphingobium sp.]|uniref:alginate export family protein n=1 Tax=Novosphingobium sp. TaxID=1874826 RepID=UPI0035AF5BB5